ncbi:MAG: glycoside hydrolase family 3 N-terminal domain-containing protein [Saprospiraceae bacterium]|nr:glycoside hydrolase family 3 N-terminal domain-containing protein [Saprospiraceae bacterium]
MKNIHRIALLSICWVLCLSFFMTRPAIAQRYDTDKETRQRVFDIMSKMTLTDKIGEMTQLTIDMILVGQPYNVKEPQQIDEQKLRDVLLKHRVGSILNVAGHGYTREEWHQIITVIQNIATKEKPTGIPVLYGIDAVHGANYTLGATWFPQEIGLAATWNPDLAHLTGKITAYETKASYIPWTFAPVLDIGRDPRWSRLWEDFGEDVLLSQRMGAAMTKGFQGDNLASDYQIAACLKHFLGYSMPWTGKDRTSAFIPDRQLYEIHVPPFQAAVDAGAATIMICSGDINGEPVHASKRILTDLLRNKMGFKGLAVSDWNDIVMLYERHKIAKDYKDAIRLAINAGVDMSMVPTDLQFPVLLKELVLEGEVPMSRIDEAVERILTLKVKLGLFENPIPKGDYSKFASPEHADAAFQTALESITLLKNDKNILPLAKNRKVLVTGPTANSLNALNGGWSGTWQGDNPKYNTPGKQTILEAIQNEIGKNNVSYIEGVAVDKPINIAKAAAEARKMGLAIVCIGEMTYTETPGNINDLTLSQPQLDLVNAIAATGTPMVLVLVEGRPRIISAIADKAQGIVLSYLPGNEGGRAIADILFGDSNPSGKLPYTYPRYVHSLLTYDHYWAEVNDYKPQFEFGYGLSYTTFAYSNLKLSSSKLSADGKLDISVTVTNNGNRDGKEVVQLYISDKIASITPPVKRLRGFEKIMLKAGESKTLTFSVSPKDLAFVGQENKWIIEPGEFEVNIGGLKGIFVLQ